MYQLSTLNVYNLYLYYLRNPPVLIHTSLSRHIFVCVYYCIYYIYWYIPIIIKTFCERIHISENNYFDYK